MAQSQQAGQPNREQPKNPGKSRFTHEPATKYGMGDHYGTGVKAPLGKVRKGTMGMVALSKKQMKTPPKGLA